MIIAFQILLMIIIFLSFILIYDPEAGKEKRRTLGFVCVGSMMAFCISIMFF